MAADLILTNDGIQFANGSVQPSAAQPAITSIGASVASNAITVTLAPCSLAFRNTTLTNGTPTYVNAAATVSLVIAATDSFGLVTAYGSQRIAILAINNAGTIELAASALYGGVSLDETGVITTATASTTATGIKAAAVRTGVAYRVVGFVDATFTTATGWGSLVLVQGQGGQALAAMSSLGYGQTWQSVTRTSGTTYYNATGKPIMVKADITSGVANNSRVDLTVNGVSAGYLAGSALTIAGSTGVGAAIIPAWASYVLTDVNLSTRSTFELR